MKLVWSPESASKAYIDTVKSFEYYESGVAELVSAMAAGWNSRFIVETWSRGGVITTSIGLAVASHITKARHVCIVPDEISKSEYMTKTMSKARMSAEVIIGEAEDVMERLDGIDFLVVDCRRQDFSGVLKLAKLSSRGAVLVCKNANSRGSNSSWRNIAEAGEGTRRVVVRSVYLPVGEGLDIAHVATESDGNLDSSKWERRWIKHVDRQSGEVHVIRKQH
ncbi:hypothetical protein ACFE04_020377 [Oxalis oulophora]